MADRCSSTSWPMSRASRGERSPRNVASSRALVASMRSALLCKAGRAAGRQGDGQLAAGRIQLLGASAQGIGLAATGRVDQVLTNFVLMARQRVALVRGQTSIGHIVRAGA